MLIVLFQKLREFSRADWLILSGAYDHLVRDSGKRERDFVGRDFRKATSETRLWGREIVDVDVIKTYRYSQNYIFTVLNHDNSTGVQFTLSLLLLFIDCSRLSISPSFPSLVARLFYTLNFKTFININKKWMASHAKPIQTLRGIPLLMTGTGQ